MMLNYDISRLKQRIEFGTIKSIEDDNTGDYKQEFVSQFKLWCGDYTQTMTQQYTLLGNNQQDLLTIVIRHNPSVNDTLLAKLNGVLYDVSAIDSDSQINAFDTVTLKQSNKKG